MTEEPETQQVLSEQEEKSTQCHFERAQRVEKSRPELKLGEKLCSVIAFLSLPLATIISLTACRLYQPGGAWKEIDDWSSHRLSIGSQIFSDYDIKLFGQTIEMQGNGRGGFNRFVENAKYNFIDISYQSVLMLYGLVFFILTLGFYMLTVWRHRRDIYLMLCILLVAFNCMFAHHLTEIAYIPFIMLAFARPMEETTWKPMKT